MSRDLEKHISDASSIRSSWDLGKYLGMPVLQKRMNKDQSFSKSFGKNDGLEESCA